MVTMPPANGSVNRLTPEEFADHLDRKLNAVLATLEQSDAYRFLADPETDAASVASLIKYLLLEVFSYGPHIIEATFQVIGRLPKNRPDLMKPMLLHNLEEVDHSEMALADYVKLGGDEAWARARRITPASFAVGAVCRMLAEREKPTAYLGYMYLLEAMTPTLAERVRQFLAAKGIAPDAQEFIDLHAKEDIHHARGLRNLILRVVRDDPDAAAAIEYGFDCFTSVYPLPVWAAAWEHVHKERNDSALGSGLRSHGPVPSTAVR